jgi:hypothetical protein
LAVIRPLKACILIADGLLVICYMLQTTEAVVSKLLLILNLLKPYLQKLLLDAFLKIAV